MSDILCCLCGSDCIKDSHNPQDDICFWGNLNDKETNIVGIGLQDYVISKKQLNVKYK